MQPLPWPNQFTVTTQLSWAWRGGHRLALFPVSTIISWVSAVIPWCEPTVGMDGWMTKSRSSTAPLMCVLAPKRGPYGEVVTCSAPTNKRTIKKLLYLHTDVIYTHTRACDAYVSTDSHHPINNQTVKWCLRQTVLTMCKHGLAIF